MITRFAHFAAYLVLLLAASSGVSLASSGPTIVVRGADAPATFCPTNASFTHRGASYTSFHNRIVQIHCYCCGKDENGHCNHQCCN